MLMVIAIIAILFPVFARVREKTRQKACLSNMNQLEYAQYEQDFDEAPPNGVYKYGAGIAGRLGQRYIPTKLACLYELS